MGEDHTSGDVDPAPEFHTEAAARDPYRLLASIAQAGPVHRHEATGLWFLLGYDEVETGLASIVRGKEQVPDRSNPFALDGPDHTGPRRLITPRLTNRAVEGYEHLVRRIVDEALAEVGDGDVVDVITRLGHPLPYRMTCELLGVPQVDFPDDLRDWTWKSLALIDAFLTPAQRTEYVAAAGRLAAHIAEVVEWKRQRLGDDLASIAIRAGDRGEVMTRDQVVPYLHTVYLAGMHTTVNQIGLGLHALLEHRTQWDLLVRRPELILDAVEEILRYEPTAQYMNRISDVDVELGGRTIPAGERILCWIAAANRDPGRWGVTADALDITRPGAGRHLAFGKGPHVCIGSWLARLELRVVLETFVTRFPRTELATDAVPWPVDVTAIRGPAELPVRLGV